LSDGCLTSVQASIHEKQRARHARDLVERCVLRKGLGCERAGACRLDWNWPDWQAASPRLHAQPDVDIAAICETYEPRLEEGVSTSGGKAERFKDFRKMLDRKDIDAVVVSTPDHWHALMTIMACAAGKDVYVEKPLTLFIKEGRWNG
jgi:hypothetical protein